MSLDSAVAGFGRVDDRSDHPTTVADPPAAAAPQEETT